ncbi:acylphosphatase [Candidatus Gottesmanbacteria bacterium]|nr:acylphosphatase [Candidatus Gottesmanbacteria bacterium]
MQSSKIKFCSLKVLITGDVTGVGFRYWALRRAQLLKLTGWVRNVSKGTVEVVAEGEKESLEEFVKRCHHGPDVAWVEKVEVKWADATGEFTGFEIR